MTRPNSRLDLSTRVRRALLSSAVLLTAGCQWVFGDYETDENWVNGCRNGDKVCVDGSSLQECKNGEWSTRTCLISCTADRCIDCEAGVKRCSSDTTSVEICNKNGQWTSTSCGPSEHCHPTEFVCAQCEKNTCIKNGDVAALSLCTWDKKIAAAEPCPGPYNECRAGPDGVGYCVNCNYEGLLCSNTGTLRQCLSGLNTIIRECRNESECAVDGPNCAQAAQ